jgi:hypothetical protein
VFLFFSVARSAHTSQADRANEANTNNGATLPGGQAIQVHTESGEKMPTDKLLDISPQALRMSSPFNAGYWTTS